MESCWREYRVDEVYMIEGKRPTMWRVLVAEGRNVLLMALASVKDTNGMNETWELNTEAWRYYLRTGQARYYGYYENHGFMPQRFDPNHVVRLHHHDTGLVYTN